MKSRLRIAIIPLMLLLWSACTCPTPDPTPTPQPGKKQVTVTVTPAQLSLHVGDSQQLTVQITPQDSQLTPTYRSQAPEIATVDAQGLVAGVAVGKTAILIQAGDTTVQVPVSVMKAPIQVPQEMPMLKFGIPLNDDEKIEDAEVIAYENALGRTQQEVDFRPSGFFKKDLSTIPAVVYGIHIEGDADLILAYSKESVSNCERTLAMLAMLGFTHVEEGTVSNYLGDELKGLRAIHSTDPSIMVSLMDISNEGMGTTMFIEFAKREKSNPFVKTQHKILTDVKDFPSIEKLLTKDPYQINGFEEKMGLRTFRADESPRTTHLFYRTTDEKIPNTNLEYAFYIFPAEQEGNGLIITQLLCLSSEQDLRSKELKDYLKVNGFDQNYSVSKDNVLKVYNASGDMCQINLVRLGQSKYAYQMYLFPVAK